MKLEKISHEIFSTSFWSIELPTENLLRWLENKVNWLKKVPLTVDDSNFPNFATFRRIVIIKRKNNLKICTAYLSSPSAPPNSPHEIPLDWLLIRFYSIIALKLYFLRWVDVPLPAKINLSHRIFLNIKLTLCFEFLVLLSQLCDIALIFSDLLLHHRNIFDSTF